MIFHHRKSDIYRINLFAEYEIKSRQLILFYLNYYVSLVIYQYRLKIASRGQFRKRLKTRKTHGIMERLRR